MAVQKKTQTKGATQPKKSKQTARNPEVPLAGGSTSDPLHRAAGYEPIKYPSKMIIIKKSIPKRPKYISDSMEVNAKWADKFTEALKTLGPKYHVPDALIAQVVANNAALQLVVKYENTIATWGEEWRVVKVGLMNPSPESSAPINFPPQPKFPELVAAAGPYILAPMIQAATIILADPNLTDTDRLALGLVVAEGKPTPPDAKKRVKADEFNYPWFKLSTDNGMVQIKLTHGTKFQGTAAQFQKDMDGTGNFENLVTLVGNKYEDSIELPEGQLNAAWSYRAIYVSANKTVSDWSPAQTIAVSAEPSPFKSAKKAAKAATPETPSGPGSPPAA